MFRDRSLQCQTLNTCVTSRSRLQVPQRVYITIGKNDGVVSDFIIPSVPNQGAELVMYFQNSGHIPATFARGRMVAFAGAGSKKKSGITSTHPFIGLAPRTRNKKNGSIGRRGRDFHYCGDSVFGFTLGDPGLLITGMYEYCDELATHFVRTFDLRYRNNAPTSSLSFDLADDADSGIGSVPEDTATTEYFPPCETIKERERNKERKRSSQTLVQTSFLNVLPCHGATLWCTPRTPRIKIFFVVLAR
jgi:hypothetical protein